MTMQRQALGIRGENLAADELERRGYAILARRYRTRHGEIDIVARDGETIVFVEVKVKDTRGRKLIVRTRTGYYSKTLLNKGSEQ